MKFAVALAVLAISFTGFSNAYAQESEEIAPAGVDESGEPGVKSFYTTTKEKEEDKKLIKGVAGSQPSIFQKTDPLDPVSGTINPTDVDFYNLYERQIRYKKSDSDFRDSMEYRRKAFEAPSSASLKDAETKITKIYLDENDKSMKAQQQQANASADDKMLGSIDPAEAPMPPKPADNRPQVPMGKPGDGMEQAPEKLKDQEAKAKTEDKTAEATTTTPTPADAAKTEAEKTGIKEIDVTETEQVGEPETEKKVVVPGDAPDFEKSPF
jgi:hypothetical protein